MQPNQGLCREPTSDRVVIATVMRGSGATGVETHVHEADRFLVDHDIDHETVTSYSRLGWLALLIFAPRRLLRPFAPTLSVIWYRWSHAVLLRSALKKRLEANPRAVVYAQCPVAAAAALRVRRSREQRVILVVHFNVSQADEWAGKGILPTTSRTFRSIRRLEQRVLPAVDGIVYVSRSSRAGVASVVAHLDRVPSVELTNFVRDEQAVVDPTRGDVADLVTVGSLEPWKNHMFLLEVLAQARVLGKRYTLDVIGEGSLRRDLVDRARVLGLEGDVRFLGRIDDVRAQLPGHRAYVHSARREVQGLALIEAMSVGLPLIAGSVGGIAELLQEDGTVGIAWPLDDPRRAASMLVALLDDDERAARLGAAGRVRFLERYSAERIGPVLLDFLMDCPNASRMPASTQSHHA